MTRRLYRIPEKGKIAGVAAGFAEYFEMDVTLMRLIFVAILLVSNGLAVLVYIVLAFVMPVAGSVEKDKHFDLGEKVDRLAEEMKDNGHVENVGNYAGIGLVVLGAWFLIWNFFPNWWLLVGWQILWPLLIIVLGLWIIMKGRK